MAAQRGSGSTAADPQHAPAGPRSRRTAGCDVDPGPFAGLDTFAAIASTPLYTNDQLRSFAVYAAKALEGRRALRSSRGVMTRWSPPAIASGESCAVMMMRDGR